MSNEITLAKAEFKLDLDAAGINVLEYVPERVVPPIVIMNSASPYITASSLATEYIMNLELVVIAATATNKQATEKLDEAIANLLTALPRYCTMTRVNEPYEMQTNNTSYLAVNVNVELDITI